MIYLTAEQIIDINARHLAGQPAVRDAGQVASAAMRPQTVMFGEEMFPTVAEKAAALLHSLICTHPFVDANKRTAWAAARVFAMLNGLEITLSHDEAFDLVLHIAQSCQDNEIKGISGALEGS